MFNFLKRDVPDWVKSYPDEFDRRTLLTLAKASKGPFSKPREMNYVLLVDAVHKDRVEKVVSLLKDEGWVVTSGELPEHQTFFIEAQNAEYILAPETYSKDVSHFKEIASRYNIEYDGWFASG